MAVAIVVSFQHVVVAATSQKRMHGRHDDLIDGRFAKDNLTAEESARYTAAIGMAAIGKDPGAPNVHDPAENIMVGAFKLRYLMDRNNHNMDAGTNAYVERDPLYVGNVHKFAPELENGEASTQDAGAPY